MQYIKTKDEFYDIFKEFVDIDYFIEVKNSIESEDFNQVFMGFIKASNDREDNNFFSVIPKKVLETNTNTYIVAQFKDYQKLLDDLYEKIRFLHLKPKESLKLEDYVNTTIYNSVEASTIYLEQYQAANN